MKRHINNGYGFALCNQKCKMIKEMNGKSLCLNCITALKHKGVYKPRILYYKRFE